MTRSPEKTDNKIPYICAPLTELPPSEQDSARRFYEKLADLCEEVAGARAFVPHEHFDPIAHARFTPQEVDAQERRQVCELTSLLIVVALAPSWGGGIEVEMAHQSNVLVVVLCEREKLAQRKISRLLRGNPAVTAVIPYETEEDAAEKLKAFLTESGFAAR